MQPTAKYQPYHGYGTARPWNWYYCYPNPYPRRIRTRGAWRLDAPRFDERDGEPLAFWKVCIFNNRRGSVYEKRKAHRVFRRRSRDALRRELRGDDNVSHNARYYGDWLD